MQAVKTERHDVTPLATLADAEALPRGYWVDWFCSVCGEGETDKTPLPYRAICRRCKIGYDWNSVVFCEAWREEGDLCQIPSLK